MQQSHYYLEQFIHIYKKQSKQDPLMSSSFDYFFQTGDDFLCGHIPNLGIESVEKAWKVIFLNNWFLYKVKRYYLASVYERHKAILFIHPLKNRFLT